MLRDCFLYPWHPAQSHEPMYDWGSWEVVSAEVYTCTGTHTHTQAHTQGLYQSSPYRHPALLLSWDSYPDLATPFFSLNLKSLPPPAVTHHLLEEGRKSERRRQKNGGEEEPLAEERKNQAQLSRGFPRGPKEGQGPRGSGSHDPQRAAARRPSLLALTIGSCSWVP